MSPRIRTHTLGCKVNQYETQYLREGLLGIGYEEAADGEAADLCVVNTCTVTGEGDRKSRQIIRRMHRQNPDARIVVMGCYATRAPDEVSALPGVAEVITNKRELPDLLGRFGVVDIPKGISGLSNRHRAYVKVQDGCLLRCSFCIIPSVRPEMNSRPLQDVLDEVRRLADNGYREIVLTGIHLGHYGVDLSRGKPRDQWTRLDRLVREIVQLNTGVRVRLSSIEATEVTRPLIECMRDHADVVCPHLHVCLQSGSEPVLRRMRRRWTARHIVDRCQWVAETLDQPALTTDVIVGFPGESEADFEETVRVCDAIGFSKIHCFPYSRRAGTPAADFSDQVDDAVRAERVERIAALEVDLKTRYARSLVGRTVSLLVENLDREDRQISGTACRFLPGRMRWDEANARCPESTGQIVEGLVSGFDGNALRLQAGCGEGHE